MGKWGKNKQNSEFAYFSHKSGKHMKQMSNPPFWGDVGVKKWSPFLDLGAQNPIFGPKIPMNSWSIFFTMSWAHFIPKKTTKSRTNATSVTSYIFSDSQVEDTSENAQWKKVRFNVWMNFQNVSPMATQQRKVEQMQRVWLCIFSGRSFEDTFKNAQWRKVKQMRPMWLWMLVEDTFENTQ